MTVAHDMITQLSYVLAREGQSGLLRRASDEPDAVGLPVRFLMKHPSLRDEAIVNAYGVDALVVTMPQIPTFIVQPPEKFDVLTRETDDPLPYVFDSVVRREVGGVIVAWTAFIKGKGT